MIAATRRWWHEFFMAREVPYSLALLRITLPLVLLIGVLPRWPHAREIYSSDGATTPLWVSYGMPAFLPSLPAPVAVGLFSLLVFCLISASLGWKTRLSLVTSMLLYAGFGILDVVSTLTKYTVLATHVLLLLSLSESGAIWSVDAWLKQRSTSSILTGWPLCSAWPRRLIQLLLAICYLGAAFTKMHTPAYFSGEQMQFWMLANMNFENPLGEYLSLYPPISVISAYLTILWEVLFVALVWRRPLRWVMLGIGILFHLMTTLMLGLIVFPLLCIAMYVVFLDDSDIERSAVAVRSWATRWNLRARRGRSFSIAAPAWISERSSLAGFVMLAALCSVIGVEVEYHLDVYQQRTVDGPLALEVLDDQTARQMLGPEEPIRPQDLFFSFDVGTTTVGGLLADRREQFETGEQAILQCCMTPPHPDMWVEVELRDDRDRVIRRFGQVIPRESLRSNFTYLFDDVLTPGRYNFVVTYDDRVIARRPFLYELAPQRNASNNELTAAR